MSTPYDGKILLVNWLGRNTPGVTIADTARLVREKMPNVTGLMLKTSNGVSWQGHLSDDDPKAVTGVVRIREWVAAFDNEGLEIHAWGVPRARRSAGATHSPDLEKEADKFIAAATVTGVRSLLIDVEHGPAYWLGSVAEAQQLMRRIRDGVGPDVHIGMILDGRRNRPFNVWVEPWLPYVNSLHPMVYPILFGSFKSIDQHLGDAFHNLGSYNRPIVPMLQAFGEAGVRPTADQISQQGHLAWTKGAAGISFFRLGSDLWSGDGQPHTSEREYAAIALISRLTTVDEPALPHYTWQDVINAAVTVAARSQDDWQQWFAAAGVWNTFNNALRPHTYSGPAIEKWPLALDLRRQILELLALDADRLIQVTIEAQQQKQREEKLAAARQRERRGSIIGIHGAPGVAAPRPDTWDTWIHKLKEMGVRWYKQCDFGDPNDLGPHSVFAWVKRLKEEGIEPIVRYLVSEQFPEPLPDHYFAKMRHYAGIGVIWAEIGNEPNLDIEWRPEWRNRDQHQPMRHTNPEVIRLIAETWLRDADRALDTGVRPAFYAFAPTDWRGGSHPLYSSVFFTQKVIAYLAQHHRATVLDIFRRGGWLAVHAATYEQPVDFDPYRPDGTIWDMTLRSYEVPLNALREHFGADLDVSSLVVMSTEGGVFTPDSTSMNGHIRLNTNEEHGQQVAEMFRWLERHSPLQAICPWCISVGGAIGHFNADFQFDGWIEEINGALVPRAVYQAMRQLRFDLEREGEQQQREHAIIRLDVPFLSQFDATAASRNADCGPTCMAMILNANKEVAHHVTVDELYNRHLPHKGVNDFTSIAEMLMIGRNEGLTVNQKRFADSQQALSGLRELVQPGTPFVALVNYNHWDEIAQNNFRGGHFVVVSGYDEEHVFVHDPLFRGARRSLGEFFVWRNQRFLAGWGSGHEIDNPNFVAIVPDKRVACLEAGE
jgi:uncharacterized protein YvpB